MSNQRTIYHRNLFKWVLICLLSLGLFVKPAQSDEVIFVQKETRHELTGEILVEAADGGVLFLDRDSKLWLVQGNEVVSKQESEEQVPTISKKEISEKLLAKLPSGFRIETTDHWVVAYNTERVYAKYIGGLYERLLRGFTGHWKSKRKWKLPEPTVPLVAIVFRNFNEYSEYVQQDLGMEPPSSMVAYYNLMTNHVIMYDLTSSFGNAGSGIQNDRQILEILSNPNAIAMVATIVHEGTHQLMFNNGMQQRLSATPLWVNEGLAMYFETPDLSSNQGWRAIGQINTLRLSTFRLALSAQPRSPQALETLITDDSGFRDPATLMDRYAESWALNYFLLTRYSQEYVEYLQFLSSKKPLVDDSAETRLANFQQFFPQDLAELDREFIEFISKLR